ncbi:hypothetical protein KAI11_00130 [Candidatus Bathyarchaeota archaeon]|nr:hypothetical protein [Candidatus Bathyarchaeota archaeon]
MSETLPRLRVNANSSITDYRKKANEFIILMENARQETKKFLMTLTDKVDLTLREEAEIKLLKRTLILNDSFNALILISLYAINDYKTYLDALEKYASKNDKNFILLLEKAKEIAKRDREEPSTNSMIS